MSGKKNEVKETSQQRALADYAAAQWADYKQRWLPVHENLAAQIQEMGKSDSSVRGRALGRASTDTAIKFDQAQGALEKAMANNVNLGSSRSKLAITGLADDKAKSSGLGATMASQQVDDAYTEALGALAATGRGERQAVGNSLARQAETSAQQAAADAEMALQNRAGNAQMVGEVAGLGLQQGMGRFGTSSGGPPGGYLTATNVGGSTGDPGMSGGYILPKIGGP
jgi:hypothetical protein